MAAVQCATRVDLMDVSLAARKHHRCETHAASKTTPDDLRVIRAAPPISTVLSLSIPGGDGAGRAAQMLTPRHLTTHDAAHYVMSVPDSLARSDLACDECRAAAVKQRQLDRQPLSRRQRDGRLTDDCGGKTGQQPDRPTGGV